MRTVIRFLLTAILCLVLCGSAAADGGFIPELETWDWTSMPMEATLSADVQTHMPYDENRVQQLNALIKHMSLKLHFQQLSGEAWSGMTLLVDDHEALTALQRESAEGVEVQFSVAPTNTYGWSRDSGLTLSDFLGGGSGELWLDGSEISWMDDALALFDAMTTAMPERLTDKKYIVTIEDMGKAVRKQTLIIPKNASDGLGAVLAELCPDGELRSMLSAMIFSGRQSLTLWRSEDGQILRADWSGNAGSSTEDMREVSLVWRLRRDDDLVRDDLTLRTPRVKGSGRNNLIISREVTVNGDSASLDLEITENTLSNGVKTVVTSTLDLERETVEGRSRINGEIDIKRENGDDADVDRIVLNPDITFTGTQEEPALGGQLLVSRYLNKNLLEQATITLTAQCSDWMLWELRASQIQLDETNMEAAAQRIINGMTVDLVRRIVLLPQEDTLFLSDGLDPLIWQQITDAAQSALQ